MKRDYLIVGQGLAGSLLALNLVERGRTLCVIDDGHLHSASRVAAGLINPITGRRHALTWRFLDFWEFLLNDYSKWAGILGESFFLQKPMVRFLKTDEERQRFEKKWKGGEFAGIEIDYPHRIETLPGSTQDGNAYQLTQTGFVRQKRFIRRTRDWLKASGSLREANWSADDFHREPHRVRWKNVEASKVVFTQGYLGNTNPFFRELPFRCAKGELLELKGPEQPELPVLNRGKWLLPLGSGCYRAGATYDLEQLDLQTSPDGAKEIMQGVSEMIDWPFELVRHQAGIRPAFHDFRPVMGSHPWFSELVIFNGLGSKGSLMAPRLARELADHLEDGLPLHPEADIERFRQFL